MAFESIRGRQFSPATLSDNLEVSVSQIHRWITAGHIDAVKIGHRCTRIDGDSVANFLESRKAAERKPVGAAAKKANTAHAKS